MKTKILLTTAIFLLGLVLVPNLSKAETIPFKKAIAKTVKYPAFASEQGIEGIVYIAMNITDEGIIEVKETNYSCCKKFVDKVIKQIDGKKMKSFSPEMAGLHNVKFDFSIEK